MLYPLSFVCKTHKKRKDGTSIVFLQYCQTSELRTLLDTTVAIPPEYWNKKNNSVSVKLPDKYGIANLLNETLLLKKREAEDILAVAEKNSVKNKIEFLKNQFFSQPKTVNKKEYTKANGFSFFEQIDSYCIERTPYVSKSTITVIKAMKYHFMAFEKFRNEKITLNSFDCDFYEKFVHFLTYDFCQHRRKKIIKGLKNNTIGKSIKHFKTFIKNRVKRKIITHIDLSDFKVLEENVDSIYLSESEILKIYHLDLKLNNHLEKYRDLFLLGCLTGLRFTDYTNLKPEDIRGNLLHITQKKTSTPVNIPLRKMAKEILVDKNNFKIPSVSNAKFNEYIKHVCKLAEINEPIKISHKKGNKIIDEVRPKYEWVTSHTCRRSFCTNEYLKNTPTDLIMNMSGHKTEKDFRKYIKADNLQKALNMEKIWASRGEI